MAVVEPPKSAVEAAPQADVPAAATQARARLYRTIWRWHFFAGMFVAPVIFVASLTGAIYVFRAELEPLLYPFMTVRADSPSQAPVPYAQQWAAARIAAADDRELLLALVPPLDADSVDRATLFRYRSDDFLGQSFVYVDPYTGEVTGSIERYANFFEIVLAIHRRLYAGTVGRILVELATSWGIILVLTGLYLWWPRSKSKRSAGGVWLPRLRGPAYVRLRDLHAVPAVYVSLFLVLIMVTGLFFTNVWGSAYRLTARETGGLPETFLDPPESTPPQAGFETEPISIDQVVAIARDFGFTADDLVIQVPHEPTESYTVSARQATGPSIWGILYIDQYTGQILHSSRGEDVPAMAIALLYALPIHQGSIFGLPTKLLAFGSAVVLVMTSVTGPWMWWTRRPRGSLGLPRRYRDVSVPSWIVAAIVVLAIFLPVAGISLLIVLGLDAAWRRWAARPAATA